MKNIITLSVSAALFTAMFYAPVFTIVFIIGMAVLSDFSHWLYSLDNHAVTESRADDKAAWDAIFEEPDTTTDMPTDDEYNDMFAIEEEPIVLTYKEVQAQVKELYTATERKQLGIKINAKQAVLESWL